MGRGSLIVFSDDWGRHPSSCQHLVEQLLGDYEVLWINTIGTRTPKFDRETVSRVWSKVLQWSSFSRSGRTNDEPSQVRVRSPLMWPWFGRSIDRWLNQQVLVRSITRAIEPLPHPRCAITTIPVVSDLVGQIDVDGWVYYCVDDLASWPGLDGATLQHMEKELVSKVDRRIAASEYLQLRLGNMGFESSLVTHGVDLDHWTRSADAVPTPSYLQNVETPWVVFWGLIDDRLNADWLLQLADRLDHGSIVLAGPVQSPDPRLNEHRRIHSIGALNYSELPGLAKRANVLVMPYRTMPATLAMQPLKLKEYLATGLPCVVSRLPSTEEWRDSLDIVENAEDFVAAVLRCISSPLCQKQSIARESLRRESWSAKSVSFNDVILSAVGGRERCPS